MKKLQQNEELEIVKEERNDLRNLLLVKYSEETKREERKQKLSEFLNSLVIFMMVIVFTISGGIGVMFISSINGTTGVESAVLGIVWAGVIGMFIGFFLPAMVKYEV